MDRIKYIFEKLAMMGKIASWQVALSKYDIIHVTQMAIKGSILASYQPMRHEFSNKDIMALLEIIRIRKNRSCYLMELLMHWDMASGLGFNYTNNMAKYEACAMGIAMALEYQVKTLKVYGDSALVIYQLRCEWET
ncbi:hypothetical protein CR513_03389, partial [Mucuna pruriens]